MPVLLDEVADELKSRQSNLPFGIKLTVDHVHDCILVGNDDAAFCITRANIDDNLHLSIFDGTISRLIEVCADPDLVNQVKKSSGFIDVRIVQTQQIIDRIFAVRVRNNIPWKRLMEIALRHAPDEARAALREINENDRAISDLLGELVK